MAENSKSPSEGCFLLVYLLLRNLGELSKPHTDRWETLVLIVSQSIELYYIIPFGTYNHITFLLALEIQVRVITVFG